MRDNENNKRSALKDEIVAYWNARAVSYSCGVIDELHDDRRTAWTQVLIEHSYEALHHAAMQGRPAHAIDLGCGPGFFSSLLAIEGCRVDAVDSSLEMLKHARNNVMREAPDADVAFTCCDLLSLPFPDGTFDLAVSRNVTWLMQQPEAAYAEWLRVLRPGGVLLVFDANWYRYLSNEAVDAQRHGDQDGKTIEEWRVEAQATPDQEKRCEIIAGRLPLTPVLRPAWDLETLYGLGVGSAYADELIWERVWTEGEKRFYRTSPLFLVKSTK